MEEYKPDFNTEINIQTTTKRVDTIHINHIDWSYPFPLHCPSSNEEKDQKRIDEYKAYLKKCEQYTDKEVYASDYGGWPRIWKKVYGVGMVSAWPYWTPRPTVIVEGLYGVQYYDWHSLTGAYIKNSEKE